MPPRPLSDTVLLVAWRGLWDKAAAPGSPAAFERAYRRGVPGVIGADPAMDAVCRLADDVAVNRSRLPLFRAGRPFWPHGPAPLLQRRNGAWTPAGLYLSIDAAVSAIDGDGSARLGVEDAPLVLVESFNVLEWADERRLAAGRTDDDVLAAVQAAAGPATVLARVSDLVELDQLERQNRMAA